MRFVLDTTVMVAAVRSSAGASRRLLTAAMERRLKLVASVPLMIEYEAVLTRREHLAAAGLSTGEIHVILDAVAAVVEPVNLDFLWRPYLKDADDDMVLETAVNGGADTIVTFNLRDFGNVAAEFGIAVVRPGAALWRLEMRQ